MLTSEQQSQESNLKSTIGRLHETIKLQSIEIEKLKKYVATPLQDFNA